MKSIEKVGWKVLEAVKSHPKLSTACTAFVGIFEAIKFICYHGFKMILPAIGYGLVSTLAFVGLFAIVGGIGLAAKIQEESETAAMKTFEENNSENV